VESAHHGTVALRLYRALREKELDHLSSGDLIGVSGELKAIKRVAATWRLRRSLTRVSTWIAVASWGEYLAKMLK
jgi:hypothetical protein